MADEEPVIELREVVATDEGIELRALIAESLREPMWNSDHNPREDPELTHYANVVLDALEGAGYTVAKKQPVEEVQVPT